MPSPFLNDPTPAPVVPAPERDLDLLTPDPTWARAVRTRLLAQHPATGSRRSWQRIPVGLALAVVVVLLGSAALRWTTAPVTSSSPPPLVSPLVVPGATPPLPTPTPPPLPTAR